MLSMFKNGSKSKRSPAETSEKTEVDDSSDKHKKLDKSASLRSEDGSFHAGKTVPTISEPGASFM